MIDVCELVLSGELIFKCGKMDLPLFQDANFPTGKLDPTSSGEVRVTDWVKAILFSILSCVLSKLELPHNDHILLDML